MNQLTLFDYQSLDAETRVVVQQKTSEIRTLMRRAAQDIVDIGLRLIEVKARLPHGQFLPWLEAEFQWSYPSAARFMTVADKFGAKSSQIENFAPSALYLLSAPSTPESARVEAMDRAAAHRMPTVVSLARAAYDERQLPGGELDLRCLAVLSDALEEAGATGEILDHLGSPRSPRSRMLGVGRVPRP